MFRHQQRPGHDRSGNSSFQFRIGLGFAHVMISFL
jgi:hypothetical protein